MPSGTRSGATRGRPPRGRPPRFPWGKRSALDERLPEHLDVLRGERLGLEHLELRDPAEDAERGLEIGILEDAEILPRANDCEEALDSTALVL
jgi:hypothetical protein